MKYTLSSLIILVGFFGTLQAQTHEIAHKSHSGSLASLDRSGPERYGAIESPPLIMIERILTQSDTATILHFGYSIQNTNEFRVENHPIFNAPNLDIDSLKAAYVDGVILVGFDEVEEMEFEENKKEWLLPLAMPGNGTRLGIFLIVILLLLSTASGLSFRPAVE